MEEKKTTSPNHRPEGGFAPGNNANPKGRPKGSLNLTKILREKLEEKMGDGDNRTKGQALMDALVRMGLAEDRRAIKDIQERIDGKVPDNLNLNTDKGHYYPDLAQDTIDQICDDIAAKKAVEVEKKETDQ